MNVPRLMSTQHPDNVTSPFFSREMLLGGEDEIEEAYYAYSHLGCDEQMWDCEGKEVDNFVVKKLMTKYAQFFREQKIGKDVFLTVRVPNPMVETAEAKILLETLESIPRSYDTAKLFYGNDAPAPIFEVILPMADSVESLNRIYYYYANHIAGKGSQTCMPDDTMTIAEWVGEFNPKTINVIPLFEDMENMLKAHETVRDFVQDKAIKHQRVFLARSDTAMNYGFITAAIVNKIALDRLDQVSKEIGVKFYPILGVGSAPFRGNLTPYTVKRLANEYPSVHTFSIQSAFKYDHAPKVVQQGLEELKACPVGKPHAIDADKCVSILNDYCQQYRDDVADLAEVINLVAGYIPKRRKRKLHIGLFGYARSMGGVSLPRAITFTASLYSIGMPPELLGLTALTNEDIDYLSTAYINLKKDLCDVLRYYNSDSPYVSDALKARIADLPLDMPKPDPSHKEITDRITQAIGQKNYHTVKQDILSAASLRRFLG